MVSLATTTTGENDEGTTTWIGGFETGFRVGETEEGISGCCGKRRW
jgi:hypothetical protein